MSLKPYEELDFGLLKTLHALLETGGVSAAAQRLGVSQPAVSRSLSRLRHHFADMLMIRTGGGMVLTPRAEAMRAPLAQWLAEGRVLLQRAQDTTTAPVRSFRIASTDYGLLSVVAPRIGHIAENAPDVSIIIQPLTVNTERELKEGLVDLVVTGFAPDHEAVHSEFLFTEHYASLARSDHPGLVDGAMSLDDFLSSPHIAVSIKDENADPIDLELGGVRRRRVVLWTREFSIAPYLAATSDAIITVPERAARVFAASHGVTAFTPPMDLGAFDYFLTWHERSRRDPATLWLIEQLAAPFREARIV